jgi:hypothetical protein
LPACRSFLIPAFLFVLALSILPLEGCAAGAEEAALAIERAEDIVVSCYQVVLEAESAGGDVSGLLARLNEAGALLAQARVSYGVGDFDGAVRSADLCYETGVEVRLEAHGLRRLAVEETAQRFRWTMIGSLVGVSVIVCAGVVGWLTFKHRYYRRILGMKPEVVSGES